MPTTGRCLCGHIRYAFEGGPLWVAHCHCESCRRQTSSVVATFVGVRRERLSFATTPAVYHSSPGVARSFCPRCGAPIAYENETAFPGETHLYLGTLDHPEAFVPASHVFSDEQLAWFEVHDDLPRYAESGRNAKPARHGPKDKR
jgi:hypothetical protein